VQFMTAATCRNIRSLTADRVMPAAGSTSCQRRLVTWPPPSDARRRG
jgi:hypothetical protein